jgi:hypothetical protein
VARDRNVTWKSLYAKALALACKGKGTVYDRVSLLASVYEDEEFRREMREDGTNPDAYLKAAVSEVFATFSKLYAMIRAYPDREAWVNGDLEEMCDSLAQSIKARTRAAASEATAAGHQGRPPSSPAHSWKQDYLDLFERYKALEHRYEQLSKDYRALQRAIGARGSPKKKPDEDGESRAAGGG